MMEDIEIFMSSLTKGKVKKNFVQKISMTGEENDLETCRESIAGVFISQ
jgi:hypothetical protein